MKKRKRVGIIIVTTLAIMLIIGHLYQAVSEIKDAKIYKPVGKLYDIGNNKMHLYSGGTGDITVVFAAGWGTVNPYVDFYPLYTKISKHAKFAVYDRFGYGYSDITDKKRDIDLIVNEIHELLIQSGQKPPYIFAAHSLGSLETIRYTQKYKNEVKGIVLIDGGNPEFYAATKPVTLISRFQRQLIEFGIARILYKSSSFENLINSERNELKLLPMELKELDKTSTLLKANNSNVTDEMMRSQENAKKVLHAGRLKNIPLTIITAGDFGQASKEWVDSEVKLKDWSENSKQLMIQDSKHSIHHYQPEIIVDEIIEMIAN